MDRKKNVFITGSSRGIGEAIARKFSNNQYNIILNCIKDKDNLYRLKENIEKQAEVMVVFGDVSSYEAVSTMFKEINSNFGGVDILINNAGISSFGLFNTSFPNNWTNIIDTNLYSVLNCSHLALPYMINRKEGAIINISSIWGITGASCETIYSATKGAVNAFTRALAKELGPCGIRVNALALGVIDTDMNAHLSACERRTLEEEIPLGRFGSCEEAAEMVYSIANNTYITGQIITLDGGLI